GHVADTVDPPLVTSYSRGILLPSVSSQRSSTFVSPPSSFSASSSFTQLLKSSSIFGDLLRLTPRSQLKATKAKNNGASTMTKCKIGQSLEEFLTQATPDKGLRTLLMCMGEALRTIAFKVRTASCGGTACVNSFGDEQLAVDMLADKLLFEALQYSHVCKYACSEEVPELQDMGGPVEGGFSVAFDPLDGSSIVDTNFTVGTIFGVWPGDKLTGVTGADKVAAGMGIYGPRTTYVLAVKGFPGTHEFLLLDEGKWQHVKETTEINEGKMFSPGNLRATFDNSEYSKLIDYYVKGKYTLRYTGGMVPDVNQVLAPLGLLVENAGGFSSDGYKSVLDKTIVTSTIELKLLMAQRTRSSASKKPFTEHQDSRISRPRSASAQGVSDPSSDVRDPRAAPARDLFLVRDSIRQLASDEQGVPDQATKDVCDPIEATRSIPARVPFVSSSRLNSFGGPIQQSSKVKR
ncbi:hypothetical protein DY000_02061434, partial [Brassica cretica]